MEELLSTSHFSEQPSPLSRPRATQSSPNGPFSNRVAPQVWTPDEIEEFSESFDVASANRRDIADVMAGKNNVEQVEATGLVIEKAKGVGTAVVEDTLTAEGVVSGTKIAGGLLSLAGRAASNQLKRQVAEEIGEELDLLLSSERANSLVDVFNARSSSAVAESVLQGVDLAKASRNARFGQALYLAEQGGTAVLELASHGAKARQVIRYELDLGLARILDLTDPATAKAWSYYGGRDYLATQPVAQAAKRGGFNVIKYPSLQGPGSNYAVLEDVDALLVPAMISPVP